MRIDVNNKHKINTEIYIGNTIEYDMKSSQVKVTILKRTKIQVKGLLFNHSHQNRWHGQQVCDTIKQTYVRIDN